MQIPAFPLPSNISKIIWFRVPTVQDALNFCDLNPDFEEENTTQYLNSLQDKAKGTFSDSALWTGEDRRTALFWIFISTSELGTIPFSYKCQQCNEEHYLDLKMHDLLETSTARKNLNGKDIEFTIREQAYSASVLPLNGEALEYIEQLRNERDSYEKGSKDFKAAANNMALHELVMTLKFPNQPSDKNDALEWKLEKVKSMHVQTEFEQLCALVEQELRKKRHGLLCKYHEGRYYLVATIPECKEMEEGGTAVKTLLLPFHPHEFFATF